MDFDFSTGKKPLTAFGMAGLADIVFLLLIFFLLTSSFIPQLGIQVNLPQADTSAPNEPNHVAVSVTKEGKFYVNQNEVPRAGLLDAIIEVRGNKTALVLRVDKEAPFDHFVAAASIAKALDMRIQVATDRSDLSPR